MFRRIGTRSTNNTDAGARNGEPSASGAVPPRASAAIAGLLPRRNQPASRPGQRVTSDDISAAGHPQQTEDADPPAYAYAGAVHPRIAMSQSDIDRQLQQRLSASLWRDVLNGGREALSLINPGSRDSERLLVRVSDTITQLTFQAHRYEAGFNEGIAPSPRPNFEALGCIDQLKELEASAVDMKANGLLPNPDFDRLIGKVLHPLRAGIEEWRPPAA